MLVINVVKCNLNVNYIEYRINVLAVFHKPVTTVTVSRSHIHCKNLSSVYCDFSSDIFTYEFDAEVTVIVYSNAGALIPQHKVIIDKFWVSQNIKLCIRIRAQNKPGARSSSMVERSLKFPLAKFTENLITCR